MGVRNWCEASWRNRRWVASSRAFSSLTRSRSVSAASRRCACQTISQNMAAISGTSLSSSTVWSPRKTSQPIAVPVVIMTTASTQAVGLVDQTRNP